MTVKKKSTKGDKTMYTNIAICPACGDVTDEKCCYQDLILYESKHEDFVESVIPLFREVYRE